MKTTASMIPHYLLTYLLTYSFVFRLIVRCSYDMVMLTDFNRKKNLVNN